MAARRRSKANTTTSWWARARPAACWPTGCRPIRTTACCCWKPAAATTGSGIHIPVGYLFAIGNPRSDWMFKTEPEPGLNGRSLNYPRGKVIGGSSAINAMIYMRGQAGRLRSLAPARAARLALGRRAAVFQEARRSFSRRQRASRASAANGASNIRACAGTSSTRSARRRRNTAFRRSTISTPATTKAPAISTSTRSAAGAGRRRAASSSRCCTGKICGWKPAAWSKA